MPQRVGRRISGLPRRRRGGEARLLTVESGGGAGAALGIRGPGGRSWGPVLTLWTRQFVWGVGVVRGEIKTGTGSSPSWRFFGALTCGRGLEPSSGEGGGPERRFLL
ncbi:hypothetical protein AB1E18_012237 [Capra hircus]